MCRYVDIVSQLGIRYHDLYRCHIQRIIHFILLDFFCQIQRSYVKRITFETYVWYICMVYVWYIYVWYVWYYLL